MNKIKQPPISLPCRLRGVTSHSVIVQHGEGIGGFLITPMTDEERKERQKASKMKWRAANPEKRKATKDKWRSANPDKVREQNRRYRAANREKVRDQKRKYREANRAKVCEQIGQSGADVVGGNLGIDNRRKSSIIRP